MSNNKNLFDLAMGWYRSGDSGKKAAALDLFPESMLEKEIEEYKKRDKEERLKTRNQNLENLLEKAKALFPIGSLIWSDEGTDHCPNVVVGEPYIGNTKYGSHIPYGIYEYSDEVEEQKTILVHTVRISRSDIVSNQSSWYKSVVGLEKLMDNMNKPLDLRYPTKKSYFITLDEYHKSEEVERNNNMSTLECSISKCEEELQKLKDDLSFWENYNPESLTKEKIKEMVNKYKW